MKKKYELRQACFACTTPYQLLIAMNFVIQNKIEGDLYLMGMFPNYDSIGERLIQKKIFRNVYFVSPQKYRIVSRGKAFWQMLFVKKTVSEFLPEDVSYSEYYSSSRAHVKNLLLHELVKRNKQIKIFIIEDGIGTYAKDSHVLNTTPLRKTAERLLGWNLYDPRRVSYFVNSPRLFFKPVGMEQCPVYKLPRFEIDESYKIILNYVFNVVDDDIKNIDRSVLIFDVIRGLYDFIDSKLNIFDECYQQVIECFDSSDIICKPHPRSMKKTLIEMDCFNKYEIPMEILYSTMSDLDDKVLVSYNSTVIFTPKLLFDKEPIIISLHRLVDGNNSDSLFERLFVKFGSLYSNQSRVMAPETKEEFLSMLLRLNTDGK